jgi:hypothetical protein
MDFITAFTQKIKNCIKCFVPYGFVIFRRRILQKKTNERFKLISELRLKREYEIKNYFLSLNTDVIDSEIFEIANYFKTCGFSVFPYGFIKKYHESDVDVFFDKMTGTLFVLHGNKKLYFPEGWNIDRIRAYYNGLRIEQDKNSPHKYEANEFVVQEGDVIADVGAAEGIWALNYVEKAEKIFLFECSQEWIKALEKTFEPWKEKVVIANKYISNINDGKNVTLDSFFDKKRIDFIKADIEGMEIKLLEGSKYILANNGKLKLLLCTYHKKDDGEKIKEILEKNDFKTEFSKGYMLYNYYDKELEKPYYRRGLLRAVKNV